jgi:hypothetical protein
MRTATWSIGLASLLALPTLVACQSGVDVGVGQYAAFRVSSVNEGVKSGDCGVVDPNPASTHKSNLRAGGTFLVYGVSGATPGTEQLYLDLGGEVMSGSQQLDGSFVFKGNVTDTHTIGGKTFIDSDHDGVADVEQSFVDADGDGLNDKSGQGTYDTLVDTDGDQLDDRGEDPLVDADHDGKDDREVTLAGDTTVSARHDVTIKFTTEGETIKGETIDTSSTSCDGSQCDTFIGARCTVTTGFAGIDVKGATVSLPVDNGSPTSSGGTTSGSTSGSQTGSSSNGSSPSSSSQGT